MAEKIEQKYLKGLKFRTSEPRESKGEDGRKEIKHVSVERSMRPEDVLDWKDYGDRIVLVSADGQKITVAKGKESGQDGGK